ncbi:hypothetical protein ON010_g8815 [Phytophthora cinnamomi]|nr:hypothetical protein ON010_g8815 [Phytophthora cinnamomi]
MNLRQLLFTAIVATVFGSVGSVRIDHDKVQPFAQPKPVTASEKAAVKFKPSLTIVENCHPYPAVNAAGETSGGLKPTGKADGDCKGSGLGSQVYGRAAWNNGLWAIMYTWYFPKDQGSGDVGLVPRNERHKWISAVVWINNPAVENPKIIAVSTMGVNGAFSYKKDGPPACHKTWCDEPFAKYFSGTSPILRYVAIGIESELVSDWSSVDGEFQDLIMWEQLTEAARSALSQGDFPAAPFSDEQFTRNLEKARPFS